MRESAASPLSLCLRSSYLLVLLTHLADQATTSFLALKVYSVPMHQLTRSKQEAIITAQALQLISFSRHQCQSEIRCSLQPGGHQGQAETRCSSMPTRRSSMPNQAFINANPGVHQCQPRRSSMPTQAFINANPGVHKCQPRRS